MVGISFEWIGPDGADELSGIAYRVFMEVYTYEREDVVREFLDENQSPEAIRRQMLEGMSYAYIVSDGARVGYVGFVMEGDSMHLSKLYVFDGFRDRGIGSAAMDMVEASPGSTGHRRSIWTPTARTPARCPSTAGRGTWRQAASERTTCAWT